MNMSVGPSLRIGILVLGMHRAGTSLLTKVLTQLGCTPPRTLIGASENNESGYWESRPIRAFNDRLLESAGTQWDDWRAVNPDWLATPLAQDFLAEAKGLLATEFGTAPLFVLKDPRICRLVPFWSAVLTESGITSRVIFALRNPIEVAASLQARGGHPPELAHMIWLRHMLDAEAASRGQPRTFTSYDGLLGDWRQEMTTAARDLGLSWPQDPQTMVTKVEDVVSDRLRHHQQSATDVLGNPNLTRWLRETYRILERWDQDGERHDSDPDHAILDTIRAELDAAIPVFGPLVEEARQTAVQLHAAERSIANADAFRIEADTLRIESRAQEQVAGELRRLLDKAMGDLRGESDRNRTLVAAQGRETMVRSAELARLSDLLERAETALRSVRQEADADRIRTAICLAVADWWPHRIRIRQSMKVARRTGLFDADWYLRVNQDVGAAGINPLRHYVTSGILEKRPPNGGTQLGDPPDSDLVSHHPRQPAAATDTERGLE